MIITTKLFSGSISGLDFILFKPLKRRMKVYKYFIVSVLVNLFCLGVRGFSLSSTKSAEKAVLGPNTFTLICTYTMSSGEALYYIELSRRRESENDFTTIVNYLVGMSNASYTSAGSDLVTRTVAKMPTGLDYTFQFEFSEIKCDDRGTYRWFASYYSASDDSNKNIWSDASFVVKARTLADVRVSYFPNTNVEEGDTVKFTCQGDVGNEPVGHLGWFYFLHNQSISNFNASGLALPTVPVYQSSTCSYRRTSTLELTVTRIFHNVVLRCTVQQDSFTQFGDGYAQTNTIPVYYSPTINAISNQTVKTGTKTLQLTCSADAYPAPFFYWEFPDGSVHDGPAYTLRDLTTNDSGRYTCVAFNTFKGTNHTTSETTYIDVRDVANCVECPNDWVTYETSCYYFAYGNRSTFSQAERFCQQLDPHAYLVELETMAENLFVRNHLRAMNAEFHWLGMTDSKNEGRWVWKRSGQQIIFADWASGEPNSFEGRDEDCGAFSYFDDYKWADIECETGYGNADPICEITKG